MPWSVYAIGSAGAEREIVNCKEYQQAAREALFEDPAESVSGELVSHLEACASCREELQEFRQLLEGLKATPVADPGEIFFVRQLRRIEEEVAREPLRRSWRWPWGWPALAAAAMLVLFLGYSLFFRTPGVPWQAEWAKSLPWLAQESGWEEGVDLDDLDERQLNDYAEIMEQRVLNSPGDSLDEGDPMDWQDLDRQEMDLLIERLQVGLGDKHS